MMTSAGRELLKWVALVLMTGDHVNKVLLDGNCPVLTDVARVVFPIFAIVLAYNITRADQAAEHRAIWRLAIVAVVAQPFHAVAFGYSLPLNVLFTLLAGVLILGERNAVGAIGIALVAGLFVDYSWPGVAVIVSAGWYFRRPSVKAGILVIVALASLYYINGNFYALLAVPLLALGARVPGTVPRWRWTFYAYYVMHLAFLAAFAWDVFPPVGQLAKELSVDASEIRVGGGRAFDPADRW